MIDLEQIVEVKWCNSSKQHYIDLGYQFTKMRDSFYVKAKDLPKSSKKEVIVKCDVCENEKYLSYGNYIKVTKNHTREYLCKSCSSKRRNNKYFNRELFYQRFTDFTSKNNFIPMSPISDYKNAKSKLKFICPKHGEQTIVADNLTRAVVGCKGCMKEILSKKHILSKERIIEIVESNGNTLLNPEEYIDIHTSNMKIICGRCGNIFTSSITTQIWTGGSCRSCAYDKIAKSLTLTTNDLVEKYNSNEDVLLNPEDYIGSKVSNLKFKCVECGEVFITTKEHFDYGQIRCAKCSHKKSYGELSIENYLNNRSIKNVFQYRFPDCRDKATLPFDFYLPDYNTVIEFDGQQHYEPVFGDISFQETIRHDKIKNNYCSENGIEIIRIPYWQGSKINQILDEKLK